MAGECGQRDGSLRGDIGHCGQGVVVAAGVAAPFGKGCPVFAIGGGEDDETVVGESGPGGLWSLAVVVVGKHVVECQSGILGEVDFGGNQPVFTVGSVDIYFEVG